jgi:hypothetical protein
MMNKTKRPRFCAALAVATVMLLGSCNVMAKFFGLGTDEEAGGGVGAPVPVNTVSFDNQNILIGIGEKVRLNPATSAWTSAAPEIATVDTDGTVTGVAAGTTKITADSKQASVVVVPADNVITVTNTDDWNKAFSAISSAGGANYILKIQGNFDVAGTESDTTFNGENKKVRLTGTGTVSLLSSSKGSIVRTKANQTFIFDGPTLVGMSDNDKAVVYVGGGGAELRNGTVCGNGNTHSTLAGFNANGGGGVCVSSGTFEMSGGTVSGNKATYGGAGVYVYDGTFEMSGGTISGNEATGAGASGYGGGVKVQNGTFEMSGGTITGNIARGEFGGGGVCVYASGSGTGTFSKTGGTINGEDTANTITHTGSLTNTATNSANPGKNGHAVALFLDQSVSKLFYRNKTLGPTDKLTTKEVAADTTDQVLMEKGFEGKR